MRLFSAKLPTRGNMSDAFITFHAKDPYSFFIDREHNADNPFSIIGASPKVLSELEAKNYLDSIKDLEADLPFDFNCGVVGFYSYEGVGSFLAVDRALVFDHKSNVLWFIGIFETLQEFQHWEQAALLRLALIGGEKASYINNNPVLQTGAVTYSHSDDEYLELIAKAKDFIAKGDAYQLCLTNQITVETSNDPFAVYLRLRAINPSPYATYIRMGDVSVVSSSPEQFIRVSGELVSTKPIKGTRPRSQDANEDRALALELAANTKERAENLMIVDLMRNDLGKISAPADVVVGKLFDVESYSSVHQLVSTITAKLLPSLTIFDAIAACFPAGSMTGAPKIRAMEILQGLEGFPRGIYSGCLGYVSASGSADLGMTIRTIVFEPGKATIGIGGGITIDSVAQEELAETKLKARVLLQAFIEEL